MKRKITFLIAALFALTLITQSFSVMGQTKDPLTATFDWAANGNMGSNATGTVGQITLTGAANSANNPPAVTSNTLRIYAHRSDGDGASATFTAATNYKISAIQVTSSNGGSILKYATDGGSTYSGFSFSNNVATVSGLNVSSITLKNCQNSGNNNTTIQVSKVVITCASTGGSTTHTLNYLSSNGSISGVDVGSNAVVSGASIAEGATVTLTATPDNGYKFVSWSDGDDNSTLSSTTSNPTTFTMGTADVTVTASFEEAWKVTLNSNGIEHDELVVKGQSISLTAPNNIPTGYKYRGWTLSTETPISIVSTTYTPSENVKLYAVFGIITYGDFEKVSSSQDDWSGRYLIVYESDNKIFDGSLEELDVTNNYQSVTISNNKISKTGTEDYLFTIEKIDNLGNYSIKSASGYYIGNTTKNNGLNTSKSTVYSNTISYDDINKKPIVTSSGTGSKTLSYNNASDQKRFRYLGSTLIQLYKQAEDDPTGYYISVSAPVTSNITITTPTTISAEAVLDMGSHSLTIGTGGSLVIEDGGQLICSNSVAATIKKNITASTAKSGEGWYTISSPVHDGTGTTLAVTHVTNLTESEATGFKYDMFSYNEASNTWLNQKVSTEPGHASAGFTTMTKGLGYLYRSSGEPLSFVGNTNSGAVNCPLSYSSGVANLQGFNLIGNPYPHSITKGDGAAINDDDHLAEGFYVMSNAGGWTACDDGDEIEAKQGILVKTSAAVAGFKIQDVNYVAPSSKANNDNIKFVVANSQYEDVAYARFDKGIGLNKINHRNADIPMLYINQNNEDYAIAMMSDDTKVFNLNFKAMTTSQYTLSLKSKGNYSYLHLIDRLTGKDIDLLLDNEYTFIGSPKDADNRFLIKLSYEGGNNNTNDEIFAYQSGGDIIVNGEGELQVFDVTGRKVATQHVNGVETINVQLQGVYIFRLNEKVQKIVVR